jgi:hypothetical protein
VKPHRVLENMRSPNETEMAFMGILKVPGIKSFSGNCGSKVLEKFQIFSAKRSALEKLREILGEYSRIRALRA